MGITTILRGFKVPVSVLDLFLRANGVMETWGSPPFYDRDLDEPSTLLRAKMGTGDTKTRLFIPYRMGQQRSTFAYIAYDWVMVFAQRKINLAEELADRAPPGFEELRKEIMGFASEGLQASGQEEDLTGFFVITTDEQDYVFAEPYMRKSDLRCDQCDATFVDWFKRQQHRRDVHGSEEGTDILPDDL
ncbi:hypothetical protein QBC46DRAFT_434350 [Diplogelasinospora grovesii]|uniref:C2H2-type domain-containing protein n=1 Tax=Diplogelasinospora grovesii TaxID=303347 RepID=A0AAN6RY69_9PEZI|nr:hypothetical protein QBC46DRAFT_434350 [Diplogelasinospora grovesii]